MEEPAILASAMLGATCLALLAGFPVAFTLAGVAIIFSAIGHFVGVEGLIGNLPGRIFGGAMTNDTLIAVPLFIYMGIMLERSRIAEDLLVALGGLFGRMPGGLGVAVVIVGALLAASTGIVGATVVAMGVISLPTMLRAGYAPSLASGTICAAGTLGQIVPPSIVLVILGDQISAAYQEAQSHLQQVAWAEGNLNFTPQTVSVGDLFAGALFPGLMLVGLYLTYLIAFGQARPDRAPPLSTPPPGTASPKLFGALAPPLLLIVAVLGSILFGIAPPSEAAAVGAVGATLLAGRRVPLETPGSPSHDTTGTATTVAALSGVVLGGIVGAAAFIGSEGFLIAPLATGGIGALGMTVAYRSGYLTRCFRRLDTRGTLPIGAAGAALLALVVLNTAADLRIGRDDIPFWDAAAIAIAALLTAIVVWGVGVAFYRCWRTGTLSYVNRRTLEISAMIFTILIGASLFSLVFRGLAGDDAVASLLHGLPGGGFTAILTVMLVMFVLGFFLDFVEIALVVVPIVAPILLMTGDIGPVWLGVLMAMNLQTSFLTPPFGFSLFYLRGVAPDSIRTMDIYRGAVPFILLQVAAIALVWAFPMLSEWLPGVVFG